MTVPAMSGRAFHQAVFVAAVLDQLAVPQRSAEAPVEGLHIHGIRELQFPRQPFEGHGLILLLQPFHDGFTAGDGTGVFLGFALGVGVGAAGAASVA